MTTQLLYLFNCLYLILLLLAAVLNSPALAISAMYVLLGVVGHGPAGADRLARAYFRKKESE